MLKLGNRGDGTAGVELEVSCVGEGVLVKIGVNPGANKVPDVIQSVSWCENGYFLMKFRNFLVKVGNFLVIKWTYPG